MMNYNNSELYLYLMRDNILYLKIISLSSDHEIKEEKYKIVYEFNDTSLINCKTNDSNFIKCLYYKNDLEMIELNLNDENHSLKSFGQINDFLQKDITIKTIEFAISNTGSYLICVLGNDYKTICFKIDILYNNINLIPCSKQNNCIDIKVYFILKNQIILYLSVKRRTIL